MDAEAPAPSVAQVRIGGVMPTDHLDGLDRDAQMGSGLRHRKLWLQAGNRMDEFAQCTSRVETR